MAEEKYYAKVMWHVDDIKKLKPSWSEEQCRKFLEENEKNMRDRITELGWGVMQTFVSLEKELSLVAKTFSADRKSNG